MRGDFSALSSFCPHPFLLLLILGQSAASAAPKPASSSYSPLPWPTSIPVKPGSEGWRLPDLPSRASGTRHQSPGGPQSGLPACSHSQCWSTPPGPHSTILHCHFTLLGDFGALSPLIIGDLHPEGSDLTSVSRSVVSEPPISLALGAGPGQQLLLPSTYKG